MKEADMNDIGNIVRSVVLKHLQGRHNQASHGNRGNDKGATRRLTNSWSEGGHSYNEYFMAARNMKPKPMPKIPPGGAVIRARFLKEDGIAMVGGRGLTLVVGDYKITPTGKRGIYRMSTPDNVKENTMEDTVKYDPLGFFYPVD